VAWQHISPEVTVKGLLRNAVYPKHWMRLMMICCGMAAKRRGTIRVSV